MSSVVRLPVPLVTTLSAYDCALCSVAASPLSAYVFASDSVVASPASTYVVSANKFAVISFAICACTFASV